MTLTTGGIGGVYLGWHRQLVAGVAEQQDAITSSQVFPTCEMSGRMRRKIFDKLNNAYFVTFSCYRRRRLLDSYRAKGIVVHFLATQLNNQKGRCIGYVIMPDHVHTMINFDESDSLSTFMNQWKRRSSMQLKKLLQSKLASYSKMIDSHDPMWQAK